MTRALSIEEPCAAKVACTVLKASGGSDPFAEPNRDLRMNKLQQKISGFRTDAGAQRFARLRGFISTVRKQGLNVLEALSQVFDGRPWKPPEAQPA